MLKTFVIIAFMAAFVLFASIIGMIAFSSEESNTNNEKQPAIAEHSNSESGGTRANENASQHAAEGKKKAEWYRIFTNHLTDWLLVLFNGLLVAATIALFVSGERNVEVARKSANAAKDSADAANKAAMVAEKTLIAGQRAWIRIDEIGLGGEGLAFDQNGASVAVSFKITNVGNSPAINITAHAWLIALKHGGPFALQEQQRLCSEVRKAPFGIGFTLFPGETFPTNMGLGSWSLGTNTSPDEIKKGLEPSADGKHIALQVFGCVDYTFATDPTIHHQTGFIRDLRKRGTVLLNPADGIIPIDQLVLTDAGVGMGMGQYAD